MHCSTRFGFTLKVSSIGRRSILPDIELSFHGCWYCNGLGLYIFFYLWPHQLFYRISCIIVVLTLIMHALRLIHYLHKSDIDKCCTLTRFLRSIESYDSTQTTWSNPVHCILCCQKNSMKINNHLRILAAINYLFTIICHRRVEYSGDSTKQIKFGWWKDNIISLEIIGLYRFTHQIGKMIFRALKIISLPTEMVNRTSSEVLRF